MAEHQVRIGKSLFTLMMMMDRAAAAAAMRSRKTGAVITVDTRVLNDGARSDNQNVDKTTSSQDLQLTFVVQTRISSIFHSD